PDIATLSLGIEVQAATVSEAQTQATEAMNKVMTALTDNGVAKKDIQTQRLSIYPVTKWVKESEEQIVIGYRITNMVTAKIRDIDKTGTIIDAVARAGGDFTQINNIGFSIDDPSKYYEEAREKAMANAIAKARQLAKLSDVTLGKPTYISESVYMPSPIFRGVAEAAPKLAPAETPISPGEMKISLTVQVTYAILD
ncbi:SIMPL domain-containing protein, partial [Chloroflexota bacterium]